jgi:hypothetical protein
MISSAPHAIEHFMCKKSFHEAAALFRTPWLICERKTVSTGIFSGIGF